MSAPVKAMGMKLGQGHEDEPVPGVSQGRGEMIGEETPLPSASASGPSAAAAFLPRTPSRCGGGEAGGGVEEGWGA